MAEGEVDIQSQMRVQNVSIATVLAGYGVWESDIFKLNRGQSRLKGYAASDVNGVLVVQRDNKSWEPNLEDRYPLEVLPQAPDKCFFYNASSAAYTDETLDAGGFGQNDVYLPPQEPIAGDILYIGSYNRICKLKVDVGTASANISENIQAIEVYNGSWTPVSGLTDNSSKFANLGENYVTFTFPGTQSQVAVNGSYTMYWARIRNTSCSMIGTKPVANQIWVYPLGSVDFELPGYAYNRLVYTNTSATAQSYFRAVSFAEVIA